MPSLNSNENMGNIFSLRKIYLNDLEKGQISLDEVERELQTSHIILVDIRGQSGMSDFSPKAPLPG
jgi:hypothetical protein